MEARRRHGGAQHEKEEKQMIRHNRPDFPSLKLYAQYVFTRLKIDEQPSGDEKKSSSSAMVVDTDDEDDFGRFSSCSHSRPYVYPLSSFICGTTDSFDDAMARKGEKGRGQSASHHATISLEFVIRHHCRWQQRKLACITENQNAVGRNDMTDLGG